MKTFEITVLSNGNEKIKPVVASRVTESGSFVYFWDDKDPVNIVAMFSTSVVISILAL